MAENHRSSTLAGSWRPLSFSLWMAENHRSSTLERSEPAGFESVPSAATSKKHDLERGLFWFSQLFSIKHLHFPKLMIGNGDNPHLALRRHCEPHGPPMYLSSLFTRYVARIDGKLQHHEAIFEQHLSKSSVVPAILFRFNGQVEHRNQPHSSIRRQIQSSRHGFRLSNRTKESSSPATARARLLAACERISPSLRRSPSAQ